MNLALNANHLYDTLRADMQRLLKPTDWVVGVASGGAWLAEALVRDLKHPQPHGVISSAMHRDDFAKRGLANKAGTDKAPMATKLPLAIDGAHVWLIDDVLYTGRTIRAVVNELFDHGRPASVRLAVLVDRGGRELPVAADCCAARVSLQPNQTLSLVKAASGGFEFSMKGT
jgi:pyrimidine operon attenuation protein / uracil phosphoribosyltransferase